MPSKELHHLRRTVDAARKLVKKPVIIPPQTEADNEPSRPATPTAPRQ